MSDSYARHLIENALDETLVVEAAAGTGKTTALVRRVVRILAEGRAEVEQIVAVTFTEKAAGELKLRLRERLDGERAAVAEDATRRARLDAALKQLEEAHVNTIHGFCADLLRERPVEALIDPLFEVLTEPAAERLFADAFNRWLQEQLADPPEGIRRALRRTSFGGDEGPIDRLRQAAWDLTGWRDFTAPWTRNPFDRNAQIDATVASLHEVATVTNDPASRNDPLYQAAAPVRRLSEEITLQQTFGDHAGVAVYDGWEARLVDLSRDRVLANARHGRGALYRDGVPRERVIRAMEGLRGSLDRFRMDADADLAALLQQELRGAIERYERMKRKAGALDFLDLLLHARNLVRDNPQVRRGFQERFKRIFVDEFQDTDPLQAEILLLLAADDPDETDWRKARPAAGRLFLVGDPKQSIYRFRRADVSIYRDVCRQLEATGGRVVQLTTSFRSVPEIQACVNAAFAPVMNGDDRTLQAPYVPLLPHRPPVDGQPSIVALPVPRPYARRYISGKEIDSSLPQAVGALVEWIVESSGWRVTERSGEAPVPVTAKHICLLFRRFISWRTDVTRPYVEALEARGLPHVLVGGRAFHEREEVEALRAALTAIEWPDDELSVFATLRGPFFAIGDEELLEYVHRFGRTTEHGFRRHSFHPYRVPDILRGDPPAELRHLQPIAGALASLNLLHRHRNRVFPDHDGERPWGGTSAILHRLLKSTRAHVGLALRPGGEQALANVLHVAELARQYEAGGGTSFRGFVEELRTEADTAHAAEAPILEEDSDGVRMMTVHKAKGLEFPIVILADLTCRLSRSEAARWLDPAAGLCALKLGGWAPIDLLLHGAEEAACDRAEAERLTYVAATRARDVLVVPAIGDEVYEGGWLDPLMPAIYPPVSERRQPGSAAGVPAFPSRDTVLNRPDGDPAKPSTVAPGSYCFQLPAADSQLSNNQSRVPELPSARAAEPPASVRGSVSALRRDVADARRSNTGATSESQRPDKYEVVWWDPHVLTLETGSTIGLRRDDLIAKDGDSAAVAARLAEYDAWKLNRDAVVARASVPSRKTRTVSEVAVDRNAAVADESVPIEVIDVSRVAGRPFGPRFGTLVHAILATAALDADEGALARIGSAQGRLLIPQAADEEVYAAVEVAAAVLRQPLFDRVRNAEKAGKCHRELPIIWHGADAELVEGTIDLVFDDEQGSTVVDFKTDRELDADTDRYRRQLQIYCRAIGRSRDGKVRGVLLRV
jgi:ATP-dependent exoDNAse (exonuclease V) beta subunit